MVVREKMLQLLLSWDILKWEWHSVTQCCVTILSGLISFQNIWKNGGFFPGSFVTECKNMVVLWSLHLVFSLMVISDECL
jgi:hypothetical protein